MEVLSTADAHVAQTRKHSLSWLQRLSRNRMLDWMRRSDDGKIEFTDSISSERLGEVRSKDALRANWNILDHRVYDRLASHGALGLAESYLRGEWKCDDLTTLLRILYRNHQCVPTKSTLASMASRWFQRIQYRLHENTLRGSRRNIAAHYDLSNEFFELFLDPTLMYSSAYFEQAAMSLQEASVAKLELICRKLDLQPGDHVLEIGTGWGGFALHALAHHDIHLTTTTISAAQREMAQARFADANLGERVCLLQKDYRELNGQYDKIVSIEMIEAVGERQLDQYFRCCSQMLKPNGRLVIQAIVMPEQRYAAYRRNVDFIQAYIFPGGFLPSITAMQQAVARTGNLRLTAIEDMSPHYARTLEQWRCRFLNRLSEVRNLGFDERFIRMWEYYLCYCEAAFREQAVRVVQIAWDQPPR